MTNLIKVEIKKGVFVLLSPEDIEKYKLTPVKEIIEVEEVPTLVAPKTKVVKLQTKKGE